MADQVTEKPDISAPAAPVTEDTKVEQFETTGKEEAKTELNIEETAEAKKSEEPKDIAIEKTDKEEDKPAAEGDSEMPDATEASIVDPDQPTADTTALKTPVAASKNNRRKSAGGASTRKSLNKKASKARITNLHAKPGDHFLVKLKGFPEWPAIICDESMLPTPLLTSRPVTAAKPDGTYAEAYADGGKRVNDRNFPVMYLSTNEFGWVVNTALTELSPEMAEKAIDTGKKGKELKKAFELASEQHDLDHYKEILLEHEQQMVADEEARIAREEAKRAAAATPKKSKKAKDIDGDVDMADPGESSKPKAKKRKAEDDAGTPQRSDSVKKPKIKLTTSSTPKVANGAILKEAAASKSKSKPKKNEKKVDAPKVSPEERHARKEKEVLYLRHKLQRGLLTRDESPKVDEMPQMAEYIQMLENFTDMEGSIIRATKINKVLKAILKLESIPREDEFNFKSRSQTLLDKWNKLMATDGTPVSATIPTNGVNGTSEAHAEEKKSAEETEKPAAEKNAAKEAPTETEEKSEAKAQTPTKEAAAASETVEATA